MTDEQVRAALDDWQALTLTLYGEASAEPIEGKVAVGCVVRNRVQTPNRYGSTYRAVCHQRAQFSCWWTFGGVPNYRRVMAPASDEGAILGAGVPSPIGLYSTSAKKMNAGKST